MYINLQKTIPGGGNTGSCHTFVVYLEHESRDKATLGMNDKIIPFFDKEGRAVPAETVIREIDGNHRHLHAEDAKFFSVNINLSESEVRCLGETRTEQIAGLHKVVAKSMDIYADNFGRKDIHNRKDLMYYYTFHEYRTDDQDDSLLVPGLHVHLVVARNDASGKVKLSPRTNHRRGDISEKAVIKSGFDRKKFYDRCEKAFDEEFEYKRTIQETFEYCNALKHGPTEKRREMIGRAVEASGIEERVREAMAAAAGRMARKAAEAERKKEEEERKQMAVAAREDLRRKNEYWNTYHSEYKPHLDSLRRACNDAFATYRETKKRYAIVNDELDQKYAELNQKYQELELNRKRMSASQSADDFYSAIVLCLVSGNALAILLAAALIMLVVVIRKSGSRPAQQDIRQQIAGIKDEINLLAESRAVLAAQKSAELMDANNIKKERDAFKSEIQKLKEELERPIPQDKSIANLARQYAEHRRLKEVTFLAGVSEDMDLAEAVISTFNRAVNSKRLEHDLNSFGCSGFHPVLDRKGLVLDFEMLHQGQRKRASDFCTDRQLSTLLLRYQTISGIAPAVSIEQEGETAWKTTSKTEKDTPSPKKSGISQIKH